MLRDRVRLPLRVLLVGINPGLRSEAIGHHFAGHSNRFWMLLHESRLVPEPIGTEDDDRLPEWGFGITNLVARATPGIDSLRPEEFVAGARALRRKVRRWKPAVVAFVGVTVYRAVYPKGRGDGGRRGQGARRQKKTPDPFSVGLQPDVFEGARVFVLPNPSGRNAHFTYAQMLDAYRALAAYLSSRLHCADGLP
jgi:TDG/mug DNA glycosylase family protein